MPQGRTTQTYTIGVRFVADEESTMMMAVGATIDWTSFTDPKYGTTGRRFIPAGTAVAITAGKAVVTDSIKQTFLMASDVVENPLFYRGSDDTTGLYAGGIFFQDRLPDSVGGVLPAGMVTALGVNFVFASSPGQLVVGS